VEFEWDEAKSASNLKKHGISFHTAVAAFADSKRLERLDLDLDYGEVRSLITGLIGQDEIVVVFTERGELTRIISARRATADERDEYWENRKLYV
jgi:uncharacterized DUF497 family protein